MEGRKFLKMAATRHRSYTASFKLSVISRAEQNGNRAAAREFEVDERCVRRWRTEKEELENMPQQKRAKRRGTVRWPDLEDDLEKWIKERQGKGVAISAGEIRSQATFMAKQMNLTDFKAGPCWCSRFMKRKKITISGQKFIPGLQISIKKEDSSSEETSVITDASGKAIGESTLKVGMFSDAEPVIIKEEFSESLLKDALPEDNLDEMENAKTGNKLDDKKQYSESTPQLPFRIKKEVPTVKLKEEPTSLLDKTGNQGFVSDPSSIDLQTGKMSVNTYPKKKNARRLSTDEKNSQRKK